MNSLIELHDSEVGSIIHEGDTVVVRLTPAFIHRSLGRPGVDDGVCEAQDCRLIFTNGMVEGDIGDRPTYIFDGVFRADGEDHPNTVHPHVGPIVLTLHLADDYRKIIVRGAALTIELEGEVRFVEAFGSSR